MDVKHSHNSEQQESRDDSSIGPPLDLLQCSEDELIERGNLLHAAGSCTNADTYRLSCGSQDVVLKTFRRRWRPLRVLFTRQTLHHEYRILERLQQVAGVPRLYGIVGRDSMLMEYIPGRGPVQNSRELDPEEYPKPVFFTRLKHLVWGMHDRGISHGDIRRGNIMIGPDNQPYLIDFATAVDCNGKFGWISRRLYRMFRKADRFAVAKLIRTYYPEMLSEKDERRLTEVPWYLRAGRFFRKKIYRRFIKQKRWRERWSKVTGDGG